MQDRLLIIPSIYGIHSVSFELPLSLYSIQYTIIDIIQVYLSFHYTPPIPSTL